MLLKKQKRVTPFIVYLFFTIGLLHPWSSLKGYYAPEREEKKEKATYKLFRATWTGDIEKAEKALRNGADINRQFFPDNKTVLMIASLMKRETMVHLFLKNNAHVNYQTSLGRTALEYALADHEFSIARKLINHGASPHKVNFWGESPESAAYAMNDSATIHFLRHEITPRKRNTTDSSCSKKRTYASVVDAKNQPLYGPALPSHLYMPSSLPQARPPLLPNPRY